jgi:molybdate transport system substrate-binding protein
MNLFPHKRTLMKTAAIMITLCLAVVSLCPAADVTVFAAASTTNAVTDIAALYMASHAGDKVVASFASSSTLAKQIDNGAPADIYLSANTKWMDYLAEHKMLEPASRSDLLGNRIVLIAPGQSSMADIDVKPDFPLAGLLADGRLSMGDPEHVPAGIYGKQALVRLNVWDSVQSKLAPMKDVRAALAMVERGEVPLGLVYATDAAISTKVRVVGVFPQDSHPPIVYPVAIVAGHSSPAAEGFLQFLKSADAKAIFEKYGFSVH